MPPLQEVFPRQGQLSQSLLHPHRRGSTQTCQQLAAASAFHSQLKDNDGDNAWGVYSKYYKRYYARIKRGALTAAEFKQWQEDAAGMRDACLAGKRSLAEYKSWLDSYFV